MIIDLETIICLPCNYEWQPLKLYSVQSASVQAWLSMTNWHGMLKLMQDLRRLNSVLIFLRKQNSSEVDSTMLKLFYIISIESVLTFCIQCNNTSPGWDVKLNPGPQPPKQLTRLSPWLSSSNLSHILPLLVAVPSGHLPDGPTQLALHAWPAGQICLPALPSQVAWIALQPSPHLQLA